MPLSVQPTTKDNKVVDEKAGYAPDEAFRKRHVDIQQAFIVADQIRDKTRTEFNENTLLERAAIDLELFNGNTPKSSGDPDADWHANTVNPLTRNRCISIMAHLIQAYLYPNYSAQNIDDEEDKEMAMVMNDCVEYALEEGKYSDKLMEVLYAFVSEPIVVVKVGYCNYTQKVKKLLDKKGEDGKDWEFIDIEKKGYEIEVMPYDEIYFGSDTTRDIQSQPFIITSKITDHNALEMKYGELPNWKFVQKGKVCYYNTSDNTFYQKTIDEMGENKAREIHYYDMLNDLELVEVNGVLIYDDPDRPLQITAPDNTKRYPFAETGFEIIHKRFPYYKSLVSKLAATQIDLNDLWNAIKDMARLQATPPTFSYGFEEIDESVMIPGMNTNSPTKEAGVQPIAPNVNMSGAIEVIQILTQAQNESSQAPISSGVAEPGDRTKYEVQRLEANARTILGLSGEMLSRLVNQIGDLMLCLVLQHMTVKEMGEVTGEIGKMKLTSIVIPNRDVDGKKMPRKIEFTYDMPQAESKEDLENVEMQESLKMLDMESVMEMSLMKVNPDKFQAAKYKLKNQPQFTDRQSEITKRINLYDRLLANPLANQEAALRYLLLGSTVPGEEDRYMKEVDPMEEIVKKQMSGPKKPEQSEVIGGSFA